jgi:hypothetical protein
MKKIIVARYNENIDWTKQFGNVLIYNKGEKIEEIEYEQIMADNVGREGHTYYKYICDNYDKLEDYTVFLQGNPFDHSPDLIKNLRKYIDDLELDIEFEYISEIMHHSTLLFEKILCGKTTINIDDTYEKLFGPIHGVDKEMIFGAGAQFIVSKRRILKRPKEFYEKIVKMLEYDISPDEGYHIERLHKYILA